MCGLERLNVQRVAAKLYRTVSRLLVESLNSEEPPLEHATNKTLSSMPHRSTNTALMLNVTTFWDKTNKRLTLED